MVRLKNISSTSRGMKGAAAQPIIADDYFKSKRAAFLHALECKTGLILAKAVAVRINANSGPAYLALLCPAPSSARGKVSVYAGSLARCRGVARRRSLVRIFRRRVF